MATMLSLSDTIIGTYIQYSIELYLHIYVIAI